jgi:hypothetical protein
MGRFTENRNVLLFGWAATALMAAASAALLFDLTRSALG